MPNAQIIGGAVWGNTASTQDGQAYCVELIAQTAVTAKTIVALSTTSGQVVPAATNQAVASVVGIALNGATAGNPVLVCVQGPVYGVVKDTSSGQNFAQFDRAQISTNTAGQAALLTSATAITQQKDIGLSLGVALAAATTGVATVDLYLSRW